MESNKVFSFKKNFYTWASINYLCGFKGAKNSKIQWRKVDSSEVFSECLKNSLPNEKSDDQLSSWTAYET